MNIKINKLKEEKAALIRQLSHIEKQIDELKKQIDNEIDDKIPIQKQIDDINEILNMFIQQ